jgi:hypothetical protein
MMDGMDGRWSGGNTINILLQEYPHRSSLSILWMMAAMVMLYAADRFV